MKPVAEDEVAHGADRSSGGGGHDGDNGKHDQ